MCFLLSATTSFAQQDVPLGDNDILRLILTTSFADSGFTVVAPNTGFGIDEDATDVEAIKSSICENFACQGFGVSALLDSLLARNVNSSDITLASSPIDGYIIDYDGTYWRYLAEGDKGWDAWHRDHPNAHGWTQVSLPAYDAESGLCLIFVGTLRGVLAGSGYLLLYRYEDGEFKRLGRVLLWEV